MKQGNGIWKNFEQDQSMIAAVHRDVSVDILSKASQSDREKKAPRQKHDG